MTTTDTTDGTFAQWVILELLGHRRLAGYLTEQQIAGIAFLRLDIPGPDTAQHPQLDAATGAFHGGTTQWYGPSSVYAITPTTQDIACKVAAQARPRPIQQWELEPVRAERIGDQF